MRRPKVRRLRAQRVEPPVVLDRAGAQQGLAVLLGQAELQVVLVERQVLQGLAQPRVRLVLSLALSPQLAPQSRAQVL